MFFQSHFQLFFLLTLLFCGDSSILQIILQHETMPQGKYNSFQQQCLQSSNNRLLSGKYKIK